MLRGLQFGGSEPSSGLALKTLWAAHRMGLGKTTTDSLCGSSDAEKVHAVVARSTFPSQKRKKTERFGPLLDVQMSFRVAGARDCAPCQKWAKREGFVAVSTTTTHTLHDNNWLHDAPLHYAQLHYTTTTSTTRTTTTTSRRKFRSQSSDNNRWKS